MTFAPEIYRDIRPADLLPGGPWSVIRGLFPDARLLAISAVYALAAWALLTGRISVKDAAALVFFDFALHFVINGIKAAAMLRLPGAAGLAGRILLMSGVSLSVIGLSAYLLIKLAVIFKFWELPLLAVKLGFKFKMLAVFFSIYIFSDTLAGLPHIRDRWRWHAAFYPWFWYCEFTLIALAPAFILGVAMHYAGAGTLPAAVFFLFFRAYLEFAHRFKERDFESRLGADISNGGKA